MRKKTQRGTYILHTGLAFAMLITSIFGVSATTLAPEEAQTETEEIQDYTEANLEETEQENIAEENIPVESISLENAETLYVETEQEDPFLEIAQENTEIDTEGALEETEKETEESLEETESEEKEDSLEEVSLEETEGTEEEDTEAAIPVNETEMETECKETEPEEEDGAENTEKKVYISAEKIKTDNGWIVKLSSIIEGFDNCDEIAYQWMCDKGSGYEPVMHGTGSYYEYKEEQNNTEWKWKLLVFYR